MGSPLSRPDGRAPFKRLLLKVSGEGFARPGETGLDVDRVQALADQLKQLSAQERQVAVVVGGGNILRGAHYEQLGVARTTADYMGMLATVINGLALSDALETRGVATRVMSAIDVHKVCEPFICRRALRHLERGRVVILVGGLGSPYFTTDTTAAQRAIELGCDVLLKATKVDGVYDRDPLEHPDAVLHPDLTFDAAVDMRLRIMDQTAFTLCREHDLPMVVFSLDTPDGVVRAALGQEVGTLIHK